MPTIMVINVTHSEESRVAILKDRVLEAFEIEALSREHLKGNIYKGVVHRIHPALEAAFVDIGADRHAFLPLDEICFRNLPQPARPASGGGDGRRHRRIRDVIKPGEELLVQIAKEQFGNKPPTLTTFYSLPGRYLVLLPGSDDAGISRRIEGEERVRVRKLINDLQPPEGFGIIVRTAAGFDEDTGELARDLAYLQGLWENVTRAAESKRAPALVYREQDLVLRTIRDFFTPDIDEIHIDNEEVFQRARDFLCNVMPGKEHVLRLYQGGAPIFSELGVESQIESIFKRRVPLRSGGTIVIDTAEALTAIDVNSGGSVRGSNPEETAFRTDLEAAPEIARQLRLRDIGGIIVVDFIDMREPSHIHDIEQAMREAMRQDKARHETGRISRLGLMEISRQRLRPAAMASSYTSCPRCEGHGAVRTTESAALVALRKIHNRVAQGDAAILRVTLPNDVAVYLLNQKRDDLAQLETRYTTRIQVSLSDKLMPHQVDLDVRVRPESEPSMAPARPGATAVAAAPEPATKAPPATGATPETGKKRRRRRGGRRGRTRRAALAIGEALAALGTTTSSPPANGAQQPATDSAAGAAEAAAAHAASAQMSSTAGDAPPPDAPAPSAPRAAAHRSARPHRRSRRHGRRTPAIPATASASAASPTEDAATSRRRLIVTEAATPPPLQDSLPAAPSTSESKKRPRRRPTRARKPEATVPANAASADAPSGPPSASEGDRRSHRPTHKRARKNVASKASDGTATAGRSRGTARRPKRKTEPAG